VAVAERPAGPGGVQKRTERVVPSEAARQERTARLRRAVDLLQNRIYPFLEQKVAGEAERKDLLAVLEQDSSRFEDERAIRDWVESQIQEAIRQGAFERLPRGPLQLPQPPLGVDLVTYTMHGLLQRHGLRPVWIECMHEVDAEVKRIVWLWNERIELELLPPRTRHLRAQHNELSAGRQQRGSSRNRCIK